MPLEVNACMVESERDAHSHGGLYFVRKPIGFKGKGAGSLGTFQLGGSAMVHQSAVLSSECRVLELLQARKSLTLEQVVILLPELSWNQICKTIDELSRHGKIMLLRRGFNYEIERVSSRHPALSYLG